MPLVLTTVRVSQVTVLDGGPRMGGCRRLPTWALASPGGGPGGCWWSLGSSVLAVLVASGLGAAPPWCCWQCCCSKLVMRLVQVMVLSMLVACTLQV